MRRSVKVLANFLGAAKELMGEYVEATNISDDELNQIHHSVVSRTDRKPTVKMLADKGLSTRQIADITGWSHQTIMRDLGPNGPKGGPNGPATTGGDAKKQHRAEVAAAAAKEGVTPAPTEKYRIVYGDPPYKYGNTMPDEFGEQRDHYPVMDLEAICAIPVEDWVEDNAVLFLWATSPILAEAFKVIAAWGFEYKASIVWDKIKHVMGHYVSVRHEFLLICTRGSCQPDTLQLIDSVQSIERSREHSQKPVEFYDIIETLYTHGRKLEIFARGTRDGWDIYGHQAHIAEAAE